MAFFQSPGMFMHTFISAILYVYTYILSRLSILYSVYKLFLLGENQIKSINSIKSSFQYLLLYINIDLDKAFRGYRGHASLAVTSSRRYSTNLTTYSCPGPGLCKRYFVLQKYRTQFVYNYIRTCTPANWTDGSKYGSSE